MNIRLLLCLSLAFSMGCQMATPSGTAPGASKRKPSTVGSPAPIASQAPGLNANFSDPTRMLDFNQAELVSKVKLVGKVKLISDKGMGIISNNTGNLISDKGAGLISDKGAGLVSNNGGGIVSTNAGTYRTLASEAREESLLAEAQIEVLDAAGRVLVGPDGKPIATLTDQQGNYRFEADLPKENLVLRIRLFNGGQLYAFVTNTEPSGERTLEIDTASSLGTSYVLSEYVKQDQNKLNRLPAKEAADLVAAAEAARGLLGSQEPTYQPEALAKATAELRKQNAQLDQTLETIKAILLAGQSNLGNGLPATSVALGLPVAVTGDADGNLYVGEASAGRIRRIDGKGTISLFSGYDPAKGPEAKVEAFSTVFNLLRTPNGTMYVAERLAGRVRKIAPGGAVTIVAGTGETKQGSVGGQAATTPIEKPFGLALGPDGTLYIGESPLGGTKGRLLTVAPSGVLGEIPFPAEWTRTAPTALACGRDNTIYMLDSDANRLQRKQPGGAWETLLSDLKVNEYSRLWLDADGTLVLSLTETDQIIRLNADGTTTVLAGTGKRGSSGDGGPAGQATFNQPAGLWRGSDGTLYVVDCGNALVRAIDKSGTIRTVAGTTGLAQQGDALSIAINGPSGLTLDPNGKLVVAESNANTIKRLDGETLTVIAGTSKGHSGDGGPATSAQIDTPTGVAYDPNGNLFVIEAATYYIRKVDASGVISTVVGNGNRGVMPESGLAPALSNIIRRPIQITIDPQGRPVWSENESNQVLRLNHDGQVERIVGAPTGKEGYSGDKGPANQAELNKPMGVCYDKEGNLFVVDAGNLVVRKVTPAGVITTVAGTPISQAMLQIFSYKPGNDDGKDATQAILVGPVGLAFDAAGAMYIAEAGSANIASLGTISSLPIDMLPKIGARIRKVGADGKISTVAGAGGKVLTAESGDNALGAVMCMVFDKDGRLILADGANNQLKLLPKNAY